MLRDAANRAAAVHLSGETDRGRLTPAVATAARAARAVPSSQLSGSLSLHPEGMAGSAMVFT
jgi:hypothetical protein